MRIPASSPRVIISLLVVLIAVIRAPLFGQANLPSIPPVPVVTDDGSADADSDTPMTVEPPDPVLSVAEPPINDDAAADPNYVAPQEPYQPGQPATNSSYEGPVGVTGIFNGNVNTGCSYDPLGHSAHRAIDDIVVPGSIGKYPLKMTRYYNSR